MFLFPKICMGCKTLCSVKLCSGCTPKPVNPVSFGEGVYYLYPYQGVFRRLLHAFKFERKHDIAKKYLIPLIPADFLEHYDVVIPVPVHWFRLIQRGFNHMNVLLKGFPHVRTDVVKRRKYTGYLHRLSRAQRVKIIQNAFFVKERQLIKDRSILVVDDIFTTGSTFYEIKRVLIEHQARNVNGLFISHAGKV